MDLKIRENQLGNYIIIHSNDFEEGIKFACENKVEQIQLRGAFGKETVTLDFKKLDCISKTLKTLSFSGFNSKQNKIDNFSCIYHLENLSRLYIPENHDFQIVVSEFKNLHELSIVDSPKIIGLNNTKIEILIISGYSKQDLSYLEGLEILNKLHIYNSKKLETLKGIENLKSLRELRLAYNNNIANIDEISKTKIEKLHIEKCKKMIDFSSLRNNSNIKDLFITELNSINFINSMKSLEKFHFWNCLDGNLHPIFDNINLKQVSITKNKKHYTHTQSQIDQFIKSH